MGEGQRTRLRQLELQRDAPVHGRLQGHCPAGKGAYRRGASSLQVRSGPVAAETAESQRIDPILRPMPVYLPNAKRIRELGIWPLSVLAEVSFNKEGFLNTDR